MCGNRLNAWKTIPIRRRIRLTSTPLAVISSPSTTIRPASIGSRRLMQRRSVDLPLPDEPIRQTTSCSASSRSMPAQDLEVAERLVEALDPESRRRGQAGRRHRRGHRPLAALRRPVARDEPVRDPGERDRDDDEDQRDRDVRREVERGGLDDLGLAEDLDDPEGRHEHGVLLEADEVVEERRDDPPDGLRHDRRSGATGSRLSPSERAAASWLQWIDSIPAR